MHMLYFVQASGMKLYQMITSWTNIGISFAKERIHCEHHKIRSVFIYIGNYI